MAKKHIVLFHPWLKSRGGAERVVLDIMQKSKHTVSLYTWVYAQNETFAEFKNYDINVIAPTFSHFLSRKKIARGFLFLFGLLEKIPLENADAFIVSTPGVAECITFRNYLKGKTFAYVHTPLRDANEKIIRWNLKHKYKKAFVKKLYYLLATKIYKILEKKAWKKLDHIMFNSTLSRERAREHNLLENKEVTIIHPPINFTTRKPTAIKRHFLYLSRLNPPKRQDILIRAWKKFAQKYPKEKLILVGNIEGRRYYGYLRALARNQNIEIKTQVDNKEVKELIAQAKAGIFLGYQEDFGMVPLEILSMGKPLIAVDEGGYIDLVRHHTHFHPIQEHHENGQMIEEVANTLKQFMKQKKKGKHQTISLQKFSQEVDRFIDALA